MCYTASLLRTYLVKIAVLGLCTVAGQQVRNGYQENSYDGFKLDMQIFVSEYQKMQRKYLFICVEK
jgi:hypothetical protein